MRSLNKSELYLSYIRQQTYLSIINMPTHIADSSLVHLFKLWCILILRCVKLPSLESGNVNAEQCTVGLGQPRCQKVIIFMSMAVLDVWVHLVQTLQWTVSNPKT